MTGQTIEFFIVCDGLLWLRAFVQLIFFIVAINKNQCFIIIKVFYMMTFSASFGHVTRDMMMTRVFIFVVANVRRL